MMENEDENWDTSENFTLTLIQFNEEKEAQTSHVMKMDKSWKNK